MLEKYEKMTIVKTKNFTQTFRIRICTRTLKVYILLNDKIWQVWNWKAYVEETIFNMVLAGSQNLDELAMLHSNAKRIVFALSENKPKISYKKSNFPEF